MKEEFISINCNDCDYLIDFSVETTEFAKQDLFSFVGESFTDFCENQITCNCCNSANIKREFFIHEGEL